VAVAISHTASFEYVAVDTDHDEAGVAIGSAAADRLVFVAVSAIVGLTDEDINTMSIGGVSATRVRRDSFEYAGLGVFASCEVWWAQVPAGTTATISFVHDANYSNAKFSVYAVTGANTSAPISDSDFATRTDALTNALSVSVDVPANGGAIGLANGAARTTSVTAAWTYLTENLDNDHDIGGAFIGFSTAAAITSGASLGQAVTATLTGTGADAGNERGLTIVTIAAFAASDTDVSTTGTGTLTGAARALASTPASTTGTGTLTGVGRSVAAAVAFASGTGTLTAEGQEVSESAAASTAGAGDVTAASAVVASSVWSASGSGTLSAVTDTEGFVAAATTFPPVGGGGGFGPGHHPGKQRFRTRKDKSHPKVITVRIGDWPEDPQIILERQEQSEREAFHRSLATRRDEVVAEHIDEDEQALLEILAFAA
jgi:hypothetical protein